MGHTLIQTNYLPKVLKRQIKKITNKRIQSELKLLLNFRQLINSTLTGNNGLSSIIMILEWPSSI